MIVLVYGATKSIVAKRPDILLFVVGLPLVVYIAWKRWLFWWWQLPTNWGTGKVGSIPFTAFATLLRDSYLAGTQTGFAQIIELMAFSLFSCLVILAIPSSKVPRLFKACAIAYFAFVFSLSREVWGEDWAFLRATAEYGVVGGWIYRALAHYCSVVGHYSFSFRSPHCPTRCSPSGEELPRRSRANA